ELLGTRHREILLDEADREFTCAVIDQLDEPMADPAAMPTYLLAREAARDGHRIALTGDGADALLAGDHWFRRLRRLETWEGFPRALLGAIPAAAAFGGARRYRHYRDLVSLVSSEPARRYLRIREKWTSIDRAEVYARDFRERLDAAAAEATYLLAD